MSAESERPSAGAVERLATGVGEDVDDLRTRLHRALDEADRLQAEGRGDLAVSVLEEQRDALLEVHQRLEARLAEAAVEREAERVLLGAAPVVAPPGAAPAAAVGAGDGGMTLRLVASAVAAVLGVALLLSPELGSGGLMAAGSSASPDALEADRSSEATDAHDAATASRTAGRRSGTATDATGAMDPRPLALPAADAASLRAWGAADDGPDATDDGESVSLPDVGATLDALTRATAELAPGGEDDADDKAEADGNHDGAARNGGAVDQVADDDTDDTSQGAPEQDHGTTSSSEDAGTDDDSTDDGSVDSSTSGDTAGSEGDTGGPSADGGEPASVGIDLGGRDGESMSLER